MKKMLFPILAALLLTVGACTQKSEYTNALPSNVETLVSFHPAILADKAGLSDSKNEPMLQKLKDVLKKEMPATEYETVAGLLDDPSEAGIDLQSPWYLFTSRNLRDGALVLPVDDKGKLQNLFEKLSATNQKEPEANETYTLIQTQGILLAYNASTLFVVHTQSPRQSADLKDSLNTWMQQDASHSFSANPVFQKMKEQSGDIKALYSYASLPLDYMHFTGYKMPKDFNLKDLKVIASLSFEKGSIDLNLISYTEDEEMKKLLEQQAQAVRPIKNTFIDYFPQSTLCLVSGGIDGAAYYDILMSNTSLAEQLSAKDAACIKQLLGMFQDDFTLGLVNVTLNKMPSLLAYATVKEAAPLKELVNNAALQKLLGRGTDILELDTDQYVLRTRQLNLFFGVRNGNFYATNDEILYKDILKKCDPSTAKTPYASNMKDKKVSCVFNVEAINQLPIVKMMAALSGSRYATLFAVLDGVSYLKSDSDGKTVHVSLQLKDQNSNALQQLVELGKAAL